MKRILVMANDSLLAAAIAARLTAEIGPEAIQVTQHELATEDRQSLVLFIEEGKLEREPIICSFYASPFTTQEREKRDATHFARAFCRI